MIFCITENRNLDLERNPKGKSTPNAVIPSISPQPVGATLQEQHHKEVANKVIPPILPTAGTAATSAPSSARWAGVKKDSLTKEEMEKINNCNPS